MSVLVHSCLFELTRVGSGSLVLNQVSKDRLGICTLNID